MTDSKLLFICYEKVLPIGEDGDAAIVKAFLDSATEKRTKTYLGQSVCLFFWPHVRWGRVENLAHDLLHNFVQYMEQNYRTAAMFSFMRIGSRLNDVEQYGVLTDVFDQEIERKIRWRE